jgi:glutathione S-transferase
MPRSAKTTLTISTRNYSAWSLRGWLLARFSGLPFEEVLLEPQDAAVRAEILMLSPSFLVPCLTHDGLRVWDTLSIAEYLNEVMPKPGLFPAERAARARCRSICGEMHSGFSALRAALPMNLKGHFPGFKVWARAQADIDRIVELWEGCLKDYDGPFLFGRVRGVADAMFAPEVTRFVNYDVKLPRASAAYCKAVMAMPEMAEWARAALAEPEEIEELEVEF